MPRLLFCSYHCYFDPSSGAALATRDLFELLASRGWPCEVFCGPQQDFETEPSLPQLLTAHDLPFVERPCSVGKAPFSLFRFRQGGVPVTVFYPASPNGDERPARQGVPTVEQGYAFLALFERVLERFRPEVILTYGGQWLAPEMMACARRQGARVVFALHNFAYNGADLFRSVDAVLVPSRFAQAHYRRTLGLECTPIPGPWNWEQLRCERVEGKYVTFVNPQPDKGVFLFARLATELGRLRPDIPLLVVEGRGKASWLHGTGHDLRGLRNLFVMKNTPDPRDFYKVSRLVLMPSLCRESFPRVAVESLLNGIPVLGTTRGGLPEPPISRVPALAYPLTAGLFLEGGRKIYRGQYEEGGVDLLFGMGAYGLRPQTCPLAYGKKPIHIDIGGEGRYPDAINVNPGLGGGAPVTSGPTHIGGAGAPGRAIPNLVQAAGERLPFANDSIDILTLQNAPIRPRTIAEIERVIAPGGDIRLVGPNTPEVLAAHQQIAFAVGGKIYQTVIGDVVYTNIIVPLR